VKDVVAAYKQGEMTLDQLAANLAGRDWPPGPRKPDDVFERMDWADGQDYFAPGTWNGDVRRLELTGELSSEEYDVISRARDAARGPQSSSG